MLVLVARRRQRRRRPVAATLQLTPFIDLLLVVAFYLLHTSNATSASCPGYPFTLPFAERVEQVVRAPVVEIGRGRDGLVTLDGFEVATVSEIVGEENGVDWKINKMVEALEVKKHNWLLGSPGQPFPGQLIIAADQEASFAVIKKVIYSGSQVGYHEVQLLVQRTGWR